MQKGEQEVKTNSYYAVAAYYRLKEQEIPLLKVSAKQPKKAKKVTPKPAKKPKKENKQLTIHFTFTEADKQQCFHIGMFADGVYNIAFKAAKKVLGDNKDCDSGDIKQVIQQAKAAANAAAGIIPNASKGPWTKEEDRKVIALVQQHGPKHWDQIASELPGECLFVCSV